jgi:hypothetical protein
MYIVEKFRPKRKKHGKQALFANAEKNFLAAREKIFLAHEIVGQFAIQTRYVILG